MAKVLSPCSSLLLACLFLLELQGCYSKQLVLFAGPHKCGSTSVERFFHNYVSGYNHAPKLEALEGWTWPPIEGNIVEDMSFQKHKVFNFLVTEPTDMTLQNRIIKGIRDAWDKSTHGIIVGTEEFDRVGKNPDTHYDGLYAMKSVVDAVKLHSSPSDVTVVLNYRTPRVDQWISIFKHAKVDANTKHYHHFLCKKAAEQWELLDTAMNPLRLAVEYRKQGWNVVLIDMLGAQDAGLDVAHVLSCEVLGETDCQDGWVSGKLNQAYNENAIGDQMKWNPISESEMNDLEQLLRERDCYYESILKDDGGFQVLYADTIWQGCSPEHMKVYEKLTDTDNLFNAIQKQKGCSDQEVNMGEYMAVGDYDSMTVHNHDTAAEPVVEEELQMMKEEPLIARRKKSSKSADPFTTLLFLFVIVGGSMYQLYVMHYGPPGNHGNNIPVVSQELDEMPSDFTSEREHEQNQTDYEYGETSYYS